MITHAQANELASRRHASLTREEMAALYLYYKEQRQRKAVKLGHGRVASLPLSTRVGEAPPTSQVIEVREAAGRQRPAWNQAAALANCWKRRPAFCQCKNCEGRDTYRAASSGAHARIWCYTCGATNELVTRGPEASTAIGLPSTKPIGIRALTELVEAEMRKRAGHGE